MFKKILLIVAVSILPIVFGFLIYIQISELSKSKDDFNHVEGKIEQFGIINKIHKSSRSPATSSNVLYVKLYSNDTLYSYFNMFRDYNSVQKKLKVNDEVRIFNEGFDNRQNTVDIIQLENKSEIIISKSEFNTSHIVMIILVSTFLILYFYIPYRFIVKSNRKVKRVKSR